MTNSNNTRVLELQQKLAELDVKKEEARKVFEEIQETLKELHSLTGLNYMFQDTTGTVFKVIKPEGRFVHYEELGYVRTRKPGETRGTLSLKEAKDAGFTVIE
jgi:hypothetical protein